MSRESEPEQPQRTVAELLAEYGNSGEGAPRRRRRRAEDDEEVSGAQAIIKRVNSDSGIMPVIRQDPQTGEPIPPISARSHRRLRPVGQQPAPPQQQAPPQPQARQAPPQQPPRAPEGQQPPQRMPDVQQPPRLPEPPQRAPQPPQQQAQQPTAYAQPVQPPAPQNPPTGRQPLPASRPAMPSVQPPNGQSRAAAPPQSRPAMPPVGGPARGGLPPAGPGNAQTSRPAMPPVAPPGRVSPPLAARPPVDDYPDDDDFTEQGYGGSAPGLTQQQLQQQQPPPVNPVQSRLGGQQRPEAAMTEEMAPVVDDPQSRPGQQTGTFRARPVMRRAPIDSPLEATQAHPGPLESTQAHPAPYLDDDEDEGYEAEYPQEFVREFAPDEYEGEATQYSRPPQPRNQSTQLINQNQLAADDGYPAADFEHDGYPAATAADDPELDTYDEPYERDRGRRADPDDDLDDVPAISTGREWLVTAAQVGVGAIAGAAVWLGFSWLWGLMPIAAIIAAVVVVIGLIVVVRKWRKAEDLQTTVLAILAGLVVTVSPAALLLVRR